jgi:NADH dehydrogenase
VSGERIDTPNVLWTAGIVATPVAKWLGVQPDKIGRVMVEPDLSVSGMTGVFVVGDAANLEWKGKPLPGIAPVAMQQGKFVGHLIRDRLKGQFEPREFHYFDKGNLATSAAASRSWTFVVGR